MEKRGFGVDPGRSGLFGGPREAGEASSCGQLNQTSIPLGSLLRPVIRFTCCSGYTAIANNSRLSGNPIRTEERNSTASSEQGFAHSPLFVSVFLSLPLSIFPSVCSKALSPMLQFKFSTPREALALRKNLSRSVIAHRAIIMQ